MSRRKKRPRPSRIIIPGEPTQAVIGVRAPTPEVHPPTPEAAREIGRKEGRTSMLREQQQEIDAKIDQVRADAQALETAARIVDDAPILPRGQRGNVVSSMFALAAGMRLAADRFPHSDEIPF